MTKLMAIREVSAHRVPPASGPARAPARGACGSAPLDLSISTSLARIRMAIAAAPESPANHCTSGVAGLPSRITTGGTAGHGDAQAVALREDQIGRLFLRL